jgi:hypothetical protein
MAEPGRCRRIPPPPHPVFQDAPKGSPVSFRLGTVFQNGYSVPPDLPPGKVRDRPLKARRNNAGLNA